VRVTIINTYERPVNPILDGKLSYLLVRWDVIEKKRNLTIVFDAGVPHVATEDDVYKGYFIPKGAIVVPNVW